jgi:hypothetical protein
MPTLVGHFIHATKTVSGLSNFEGKEEWDRRRITLFHGTVEYMWISAMGNAVHDRNWTVSCIIMLEG